LPFADDRGPIDLELRAATADAVSAAFSGATTPRAARTGLVAGGSHYRTERGVAGDLRIDFDARAGFHLSADGRQLHCWAANADELSFRRFLLDTVLGNAALVHGFEALHAGAFELDGAVVAVVAAQGGGKSTLLAELVGRYRPLFCDDVLVLGRHHGGPVAHPGPPLMNLPSTRSVGPLTTELGRILGVVEREPWVAVDLAAREPLPLGAIVMLRRSGHDPATVEPLPAHPEPLLSHSLPSGRDPTRLDRRFALFAEIATTTPLLELRVPVDLTPTGVADALEDALLTVLARGSAA
jgi:hypothetical protein